MAQQHVSFPTQDGGVVSPICTEKARTPGLTGDEPLPEVEDAANPENLAGNKEQEQGKQEQIEEIGVRDQKRGKSKDQQQNDHAQ